MELSWFSWLIFVRILINKTIQLLYFFIYSIYFDHFYFLIVLDLVLCIFLSQSHLYTFDFLLFIILVIWFILVLDQFGLALYSLYNIATYSSVIFIYVLTSLFIIPSTLVRISSIMYDNLCDVLIFYIS